MPRNCAVLPYRLLGTQETASVGSFSDVESTAWYAKAVNYLAQIDVISGYPDGTFKPNATITRAEFVAIAVRFENLESAGTNVFSDVADSHWAISYINSACTAGWIAGYSDGTFHPESNITRAEAVTIVNHMLGRAIDEDALSKTENPYSDITGEHWAYSDIMEASIDHAYTRDDNGNEIWQL